MVRSFEMHNLSLLRSSKTTPWLNFSLAVSAVRMVTFNIGCSVSSEGLSLKGFIVLLYCIVLFCFAFSCFLPSPPLPSPSSPAKNGMSELALEECFVRNFWVHSQAFALCQCRRGGIYSNCMTEDGNNSQMGNSSFTRTVSGILQRLRYESRWSNLHTGMCCLLEL